MDEDGWTCTNAEEEDGFPVMLRRVLDHLKIKTVPEYRWKEYYENGVPRCAIRLSLNERTEDSPLEPFALETVGAKYDDAIQSAARMGLTEVCGQVMDLSGVTPIKYLPPGNTGHPIWKHRVRTLHGPTRTEENNCLVETALYLQVLDDHHQNVMKLWDADIERAQYWKKKWETSDKQVNTLTEQVGASQDKENHLRAQFEASRCFAAQAQEEIVRLQKALEEERAQAKEAMLGYQEVIEGMKVIMEDKTQSYIKELQDLYQRGRVTGSPEIQIKPKEGLISLKTPHGEYETTMMGIPDLPEDAQDTIARGIQAPVPEVSPRPKRKPIKVTVTKKAFAKTAKGRQVLPPSAPVLDSTTKKAIAHASSSTPCRGYLSTDDDDTESEEEPMEDDPEYASAESTDNA